MTPRIFIVIFLGCLLEGCWDNYFPEKVISYKDIKITWYWRSLGDDRRDFVKVAKGSVGEVVLNTTGTVTDVNVTDDTVVIRTGYLAPDCIYESKGNALGIAIRIDSNATEEEIDKFVNRKFYEEQKKIKEDQKNIKGAH